MTMCYIDSAEECW